MNIALFGYGKMGKAIEQIAISQGHTIGLIVDTHNRASLDMEMLRKQDVAIEFSTPESAVDNILTCFEAGIPVVCGTTGWLDKIAEIKKAVEEKNAGFLYASNFSVGVNIFFAINKQLAKLMAAQPAYHPSILEIHHTAKKDAPSGTAITLAEQVIEAGGNVHSWVNAASTDPSTISIISERTDPAPGTHHVKYSSPVDDIEIIHTAHSREGFASGAVLAATFLAGKKGLFSMSDVLGL